VIEICSESKLTKTIGINFKRKLIEILYHKMVKTLLFAFLCKKLGSKADIHPTKQHTMYVRKKTISVPLERVFRDNQKGKW